MDIETYREIFGYYTAADVVDQLPPEQNALLSAGEDALFAEGDIYSSGKAASSVSELEKKIKAAPTVTRTITFDNAAYNYVSVVLKPGVSVDGGVAQAEAGHEGERPAREGPELEEGRRAGGFHLRHPPDHPHRVRRAPVLRGHHHHHEHPQHERPGADRGVRDDAGRGRAEALHHEDVPGGDLLPVVRLRRRRYRRRSDRHAGSCGPCASARGGTRSSSSFSAGRCFARSSVRAASSSGSSVWPS